MIPRIIEIGPIPINSFGVMIAAAVFAGSMLLSRSFQVNGINSKLAEKYAFTGVLAGLLGARLWYVFIDFYSQVKDNLLEALISSAGFTFYGGFIFSAIVLFIMSRMDKIPLAAFIDSTGPCLALGYAIGRLGCQLSGDGDYGMQTNSVLGMSYSTGVIPTPNGVLVFPTPLYESIMSLMILFILLKIERRKGFINVPYRRFAAYLSLISLERFLIEFLRINPKILVFGTLSLSEAQIISLVIFVVGAMLFFFAREKSIFPNSHW